MRGFRGGSKDFKKSGGGIGDRDLSGKSRKMMENRGGFSEKTEQDKKPKSKSPKNKRPKKN